MCLSEARWTGNGFLTAATGELVVYSGGEQRQAGVAVILARDVKTALLSDHAIS